MDCRASVSLLFLFLCSNRAMVFGQEVGELLVRRLLEHGLLPQVWCEIGVGLGDGGVCRLGEVAKSPSGSSGAGVAVLNTGHLQQLLRYWGYLFKLLWTNLDPCFKQLKQHPKMSRSTLVEDSRADLTWPNKVGQIMDHLFRQATLLRGSIFFWRSAQNLH